MDNATCNKLPSYKCHKIVDADKITNIVDVGESAYHILTETAGVPPQKVSAAWIEKHHPKVGGYFVEYEDGYQSYSPARAFEEGYTKVGNGLTFGEVFAEVKKGKGMRLPQWQPDVIIRAQYPDENSKMTAPYLYVESRFGKVPWKETMIELFSEKWVVVE
jgi:hypothetical protein